MTQLKGYEMARQLPSSFDESLDQGAQQWSGAFSPRGTRTKTSETGECNLTDNASDEANRSGLDQGWSTPPQRSSPTWSSGPHLSTPHSPTCSSWLTRDTTPRLTVPQTPPLQEAFPGTLSRHTAFVCSSPSSATSKHRCRPCSEHGDVGEPPQSPGEANDFTLKARRLSALKQANCARRTRISKLRGQTHRVMAASKARLEMALLTCEAEGVRLEADEAKASRWLMWLFEMNKIVSTDLDSS